LFRVALIRCREIDQTSDSARNEEVLVSYAAAALEQAGICARVYDFCLDAALTTQALVSYHPKLAVVVVRRPGENLYSCTEFVRKLKNEEGWVGHITLFGHSLNGFEDALRRSPLDSVVLGEEPDLIRLAMAVESGAEIASVSGLAYVDPQTDRVVANAPSPFPNLDVLPFPKHYYLEELQNRGRPTNHLKATIQTSRGCYGRCRFCYLQANRQLGFRYPWRGRSPEKVVDEIEMLSTSFGVRDFLFYDANFFGPGQEGRARAQAIATGIIRRGLNIGFAAYARPDNLDRDTVRLMKQAGLVKLFMGVESFSQAVLDRYQKDVAVEHTLAAIELCKTLDIFMHLSFITYDYDTTLSEIRENIAGLNRCMRTKSHLFQSSEFLHNVLVPIAGTPIAQEYLDRGLISASSSNAVCGGGYAVCANEQCPLYADKIYEFSDPVVAAIAETTRCIAAQIRTKSNEVYEHLTEATRQYLTQADAKSRKNTEMLLRWRFDLPWFALSLFEEVVEGLAVSPEPATQKTTAVEEAIASLSQFNMHHLSSDSIDFGDQASPLLIIRTLGGEGVGGLILDQQERLTGGVAPHG